MVMFIVLHFRHLCSSLKVQSNARKNRLCNLFQFLRFQFLNNEGVRFSGLKEFAYHSTCLIRTMIRKAVSWPQSCHCDEFSSRFVTSAFGAILRTVSHFYPWGEILTGSIISPRSSDYIRARSSSHSQKIMVKSQLIHVFFIIIAF